MRPALAPACLATIAVADHVIRRRRPPWIVAGMFDHPAHLATAGLLLLNLPARPPAWTAGFLAGSLLPDVDHVPLALRKQQPRLDDARPFSHCLAAVIPVAVLAALTRSEALAGATAGSVAHFARDLGVGTGVPLLWPASGHSVRVPYRAYAAACALLAVAALRKRANLRHGL